MMEDVKCPYCEKYVEINHDDGYGCTEGEVFQQECSYCGKNFTYTIFICFSYNAEKADCLNGGKHTYKPANRYPLVCLGNVEVECSQCSERKTIPYKDAHLYKGFNQDEVNKSAQREIDMKEGK